MTYDDEIKLIKKVYRENSMGDPIEVLEKRTVPASKLDYRNKDFYQTMAKGLKPSITFAINQYEYQDEKELEYNDKQYRIIDVFPVKQRKLEHDLSEFESIALICEGLVNK
ncbi:phage head closure protein [Tissierella sp.]|uniref:phage head closure protein n=1 Tax=Tissierella sp. TaxID=41274 RepID=UPI003059F940